MLANPKKYQFKDKKLKNPKNKNSFIDVLESDHLNRPSNAYLRYIIERKHGEKHPKTYQLGLW